MDKINHLREFDKVGGDTLTVDLVTIFLNSADTELNILEEDIKTRNNESVVHKADSALTSVAFLGTEKLFVYYLELEGQARIRE